MKFEVIDKKLREVGFKFNKPTIERRKNKWHFELRIEIDEKQYINGYIHYLYNEFNNGYDSIGHFIASGDNLNKLVSILFERMKSNKVFCKHCEKINDKIIWVESIIIWNEVEKRFIKTLEN